jgi:hypothetical protein
MRDSSSSGVSGMGLSQRGSRRALACLAVLGAGAIAGVLAGLRADPVRTSELSPAQIVALRFPGGVAGAIAPSRIASSPMAATPAAIDSSPADATGYVLASAESAQVSSLMFNPAPTYSSAPQSAPAHAPPAARPSRADTPPGGNATAPRPALPPQLASADDRIPAQALAYAAEPAAPPARPESHNAAATAAKRAVPVAHPATPASASNAVLNSAQIASIKERLKLSSYQDQLWPPVESALRDISWRPGQADAGGRKVVSNGRGATIDPDSAPVQRLKSAAFPLLMTLSEDQKQEVRSMVRLMGLENLAAQF